MQKTAVIPHRQGLQYSQRNTAEIAKEANRTHAPARLAALCLHDAPRCCVAETSAASHQKTQTEGVGFCLRVARWYVHRTCMRARTQAWPIAGIDLLDAYNREPLVPMRIQGPSTTACLHERPCSSLNLTRTCTPRDTCTQQDKTRSPIMQSEKGTSCANLRHRERTQLAIADTGR